MDDEGITEVETIALLAEPVRRALYDLVAESQQPVSRDDAARAAGITRSLAAFHLDRLVEAGLLRASYRRLTGRTGPGAGRPSKLYERAPGEHAVSVPPRRYDLAAELLAEAVEASAQARTALCNAARRTGQLIGAAAPSSRLASPLTSPLANQSAGESAVVEALRAHGFEPREDAGRVVLANCPFHAIAVTHTALVCAANLALVEGILSGAADSDLIASLDPAPDRCCVVISKK